MAEYIERGAANEALRECVRVYPNSFYNGIEVARTAIHKLPAAADVVEVVRCKDCKHRPYPTEPGKTYGLTIEAPDGMCPCYNEDDGWYSWIPDNESFCSYGERKEDET